MTAVSFERVANGIKVRARLSPRGDDDRLEGIAALANGRACVRARVAAVPEAGKANGALAALIAAAAGVPKSRVSVAAGAKDPVKTLLVEGDPAVLLSRLRTYLEGVT